jgi:hypothetical protein
MGEIEKWRRLSEHGASDDEIRDVLSGIIAANGRSGSKFNMVYHIKP